jgi:hypothetical protein
MARNQLPPCRPESAGTGDTTCKARDAVGQSAARGLDPPGIVQYFYCYDQLHRLQENRSAIFPAGLQKVQAYICQPDYPPVFAEDYP